MTLTPSSSSLPPFSPPLPLRAPRYAVLGAGFAGLSLTYHLLKYGSKELDLRIDLYDEVGIGGGASGVSGGLLHPYSPKGKLLWQGAECWKECLMLLGVAESAAFASEEANEDGELGQELESFIVRRRGILRPPTNMKSFDALNDVKPDAFFSLGLSVVSATTEKNAPDYHHSCRIETIDKETAQKLVPNLCVPFNYAFYMPQAVNVNPLCYLQGLYLACEDLVKQSSTSIHGQKELYLQKKSIQSLFELEDEYDAVIVCLGAKAGMLPELSGRLPIRTCRGVIAHLQLPGNARSYYPELAPSILSDAWLAVQGSQSLYLGSTWDWNSTDSSPSVSDEEASQALQVLLPKASSFYPGIKDWTFSEARAGLRAMPPQTPHGSLPLLGTVNHLLPGSRSCSYWMFGGLGSRGLLYHARLGGLMARAVLLCNEQLLPSEFTSWKNIKH